MNALIAAIDPITLFALACIAAVLALCALFCVLMAFDWLMAHALNLRMLFRTPAAEHRAVMRERRPLHCDRELRGVVHGVRIRGGA